MLLESLSSSDSDRQWRIAAYFVSLKIHLCRWEIAIWVSKCQYHGCVREKVSVKQKFAFCFLSLLEPREHDAEDGNGR